MADVELDINLLHPEIKKFWEDSGYNIFGLQMGSLYYMALVLENTKGNVIATYDTISGEKQYLLKPGDVDNFISEEKMLRIIKLKAFL